MARILVVDDEVLILELFKETFEQRGYSVSTALGPIAALAILANDPEIELVITDRQMRVEIDGIKLGRLVKQHNPKIKTVLVTGFVGTAEEMDQLQREMGEAGFDASPLFKPVLPLELVQLASILLR